MQVNIEQLDPCKVQLTIEVDEETVNRTIDQVYREYSKVTNVPGFRKGKTPRAILERYVPEEAIRERAIETMAPRAYSDAIKENDIHPYSDPDVDIVQFEPGKPFIFKAIVPLPPKVELGEYKGIEVERPKVEITDEDIEAQLKRLQESRTTSEKVEDRGIETGDVAIAEIVSTVEGEEKETPRRSLLNVGENIPGFDENIIGLKPGEQKTFTIEYPADYHDENLAGKKVEFEVSIDSIRKKIVPELNDEFVKSIGEFETLDALKEDIRENLLKSAEDAADREVEGKIVEEIVSRSKVDFPDVMVEHDVHHDIEDIENRLTRQGISAEQYLQQIGRTQEQFIDELRENAAKRIRTGLLLGEIAEAENIDVTDEEVEEEIDRMASEAKTNRETMETYIEARGGKQMIKNSLFNRKLADHIKSVSNIKSES